MWFLFFFYLNGGTGLPLASLFYSILFFYLYDPIFKNLGFISPLAAFCYAIFAQYLCFVLTGEGMCISINFGGPVYQQALMIGISWLARLFGYSSW